MVEYDRTKLGKLLKDARQKAGFTQRDISDRLGYSSAQFISNIERGISVVPLDLLPRLIKIYKVSVRSVEEILMQGQERNLKKKLRLTG